MNCMRVLAGTLASLVLSVGAWAADVRSLQYSQLLERPSGQTFTEFASNVAIDGADIIVLARYDGGQSALLYHRASGSARFTYSSRILNIAGSTERMQVRMKNGIAVVQFGAREWIFERSGGTYALASATPLAHPGGIAISGNSVLFGGDGCGYDGVVYQKGTDGRWQITGRLDDNQGACATQGVAVELNYDTAVIHVPDTQEVTTWRRNGTELNWLPAGNIAINSDVAGTAGPFALQNSTVVTPASYVFRRSGNTWTPQARIVPADYGMGSGNAHDVRYRDGLLLTSDSWIPDTTTRINVFHEVAAGEFEHLAILETFGGAHDFDVSGRTVVAGDTAAYGGRGVIFTLPDPLAAPEMIAADFEDGDASDFSAVTGQFTITARGNDHVLAQPSTSNFSVALAPATESTLLQRVTADITPTFAGTDGWVGLIARYVDANNYYYVAVRQNGTAGLYRRLNGVNSLLASVDGAVGPLHMELTVGDGSISLRVNNRSVYATDRSLPRGRTGLVTWHAGADFDDVEIASTFDVPLLVKWFMADADIPASRRGREFNLIGGDWDYVDDFPPYINGYQQRDASRSAFAYFDVPVRNQEIDVAFSADAVSSPTGAWVGVLGRYVDAQTHYSAVLGNNGRVELRKRVNGVVTLLAAANIGVNITHYNTLRFRLVRDQLRVFVNERLALSVHDDSIPEGGYGLATNRAAATWEHMNVIQPPAARPIIVQ